MLQVLQGVRHVLARASDVAISLTRADGRVTVAVQDNGHGIPKDVLSRVFEPHFSTRTRRVRSRTGS